MQDMPEKIRAAGGNTSNLRQHLKDHHPVESSKISKDKPPKRRDDGCESQQTITDAFAKFQKYERGGKQWTPTQSQNAWPRI